MTFFYVLEKLPLLNLPTKPQVTLAKILDSTLSRMMQVITREELGHENLSLVCELSGPLHNTKLWDILRFYTGYGWVIMWINIAFFYVYFFSLLHDADNYFDEIYIILNNFSAVFWVGNNPGYKIFKP